MPDHIAAIKQAFHALPTEMRPQAAPGTWDMALGMLPPPCRVLDAGAGRGGFSKSLTEAGYTVTSIDLHPEHFRAPGLTCTKADLLEPLPFADSMFDLVVSVEVMEHLENPWLYMREAIRVLRDGGQFIFTSPNPVTLASRLNFLRSGQLDYFRQQSFDGCYHVTPIFDWAVRRCCSTTSATLTECRYSRASWPRRDDVPRHYQGPIRRFLTGLLPVNRLFGEITGFRVVKDRSRAATSEIGQHHG